MWIVPSFKKILISFFYFYLPFPLLFIVAILFYFFNKIFLKRLVKHNIIASVLLFHLFNTEAKRLHPFFLYQLLTNLKKKNMSAQLN